MKKNTIIAHTHWDREWFLSEKVTKKWLIPLFEKLFRIVDNNEDYHFVLDGQVLIIEDYLKQLDREKKNHTKKWLKNHGKNVSVGPYYGQIDWRIAEEACIRNLTMGIERSREFGNPMMVGWVLDNFGFSSQTPQIHKLAGIDSVFIWRGVDFPERPSIDFIWEGSDGSKLLSFFLINSYRNLMRLCDYPSIAEERVNKEIERLEPYTKTGYIPLFDGYDIDPFPEDPAVCGDFATVSPEEISKKYHKKSNDELPVLKGELLSGRLLCTFPGSLSSRNYLKIMNWYSEYFLSKVLEPILAITGANQSLEKEWKLLLKNMIHDSIGGVGVDIVHKEMEERYELIHEGVQKNIDRALSESENNFPSGFSTLNINPFDMDYFFEKDRKIYEIHSPAGSLFKVNPEINEINYCEESIREFNWNNEYYDDAYIKDGKLSIKRNGMTFENEPVVVTDNGDEYSIALGKEFPLRFDFMKLLFKNEKYSKVLLAYSNELVELTITYTFSSLPVIKTDFSIYGKGEDYTLLFTSKTKEDSKTLSGMPFDYVHREKEINYPLPDKETSKFLVAARETGKCDVFPMKDFVSFEMGNDLFSMMAKGIHSYTTYLSESLKNNRNSLSLILSRSVSWLSRENVSGRVGDAGPIMYVPGAEMKRKINIEAALYIGDKKDFISSKAAFLNPPLVFYNPGKGGKNISFYGSENNNLEVTTLKPGKEKNEVVIRLYNPRIEEQQIKVTDNCEKSNILEEDRKPFDGTIQPKEIVTLIAKNPFANKLNNDKLKQTKLLYPEIGWKIGKDESSPNKMIINELKKRASELKEQADEVSEKIDSSEGIEKYKLLFEKYKLLRSSLEAKLSVLQNEEKLEDNNEEKIQKLANRLNDLRIKRRTVELLISTLEDTQLL
ncbi:MAG: glycosyl hydrolase-related protein [Thermotogota bacterium]|nr:glycosyl hydrolase-related protein [Thermotogota bacterium]